jgi:hypothetical protein
VSDSDEPETHDRGDPHDLGDVGEDATLGPFAIATLVVVGGVSLAALIPARRAASINPATALRHE